MPESRPADWARPRVAIDSTSAAMKTSRGRSLGFTESGGDVPLRGATHRGVSANRFAGSLARTAPTIRSVQRALATALAALVLPVGWPHHVALGLSDAPGDAGAVRRQARFDARYQYLAGGVNTGSGWATWNPDGGFVTRYVRESL